MAQPEAMLLREIRRAGAARDKHAGKGANRRQIGSRVSAIPGTVTMAYRILKPLFPLGAVYLTAGVSALGLDPDAIVRLLYRHQCGDWGDLDEEDKAANDSDLELGGRLLSLYRIEVGALYLITEHDRSVTTVMLRDEY